MNQHTKWPIVFRMHGSVLPKLIIPLIFVAIWSTTVTVISRYVYDRELSQPKESHMPSVYTNFA